MAFALVVSVFQSSSLGAVQVYNSDTGALLRQQQLVGFTPTALAFGSNGNLFVGNNNSSFSSVAEFDEAPLNLIRSAFASPRGAVDLSFGPDGNLYVLNGTSINVFNGLTGALLGSVNPSANLFLTGMTFGPDGNLYTSNPINGTISVTTRTGVSLGSIFGVFATADLAFDRNGNLFAISGNDIKVLNQSGRGVFISGLSGPQSLAFAPNGNLFVTNRNNNTVQEFNGTTGTLVRTYAIQGTPSHITFANLSIGLNPAPSPGPSPTPAPAPSPIPAPAPTPAPSPISSTIVGTNRNDRLIGTSRNDTILGLAGRDRLLGQGGDDTLLGGGGNDVLNGGSGNNTLNGGGGRDIFVLQRGAGIDRIQDFQDRRDRLQLPGRLRFGSLSILQRGNDTLIRNGRDVLAVLEGINANQIRANDFV